MIDSRQTLHPRTISASFLVAGTCIGGGMLALPVACSQAGFLPSIGFMVIVWLAMTLTALFFIEAGFWVKKEDAHVITLSGDLLGPMAQKICWLVFLFISYASLIAYTAGGGHLIAHGIAYLSGFEVSKAVGCLVFASIFGSALLTRHETLGKLNSILFLTMLAAYAFLIVFGSHGIKLDLLMRQDWSVGYLAVPLLLTAFSFQTMVPSLHPYLGHNKHSLVVAVVSGTTIALIVYIIWQTVVFGNVPLDGPGGLKEALLLGEPATYALGAMSGSRVIGISATLFAFFALVTSFFGMGLGLFDFLQDGLSLPRNKRGNFLTWCMILIPTVIFATGYERIFLDALDASGGFGDTILNGMIPVLMVWVGRYILKKGDAGFPFLSSKLVLTLVFLFYLSSLGLEVVSRFGVVQKPIDIREETVREVEKL